MAPSVTIWFAIAARTGAVLPSLTVTVNDCESSSGAAPLSVTRTVIEYTPGLSASVVVHVNWPVVGPMLAPAGAPVSSE